MLKIIREEKGKLRFVLKLSTLCFLIPSNSLLKFCLQLYVHISTRIQDFSSRVSPPKNTILAPPLEGGKDNIASGTTAAGNMASLHSTKDGGSGESFRDDEGIQISNKYKHQLKMRRSSYIFNLTMITMRFKGRWLPRNLMVRSSKLVGLKILEQIGDAFPQAIG